mmetsp:Transcript_99440/g.172601  ORF Transcript_99440/g.172601 Transcript_99440/m.172601 type:complete len:331 (+) Transcript_99440:1046-2038(+)
MASGWRIIHTEAGSSTSAANHCRLIAHLTSSVMISMKYLTTPQSIAIARLGIFLSSSNLGSCSCTSSFERIGTSTEQSRRLASNSCRCCRCLDRCQSMRQIAKPTASHKFWLERSGLSASSFSAAPTSFRGGSRSWSHGPFQQRWRNPLLVSELATQGRQGPTSQQHRRWSARASLRKPPLVGGQARLPALGAVPAMLGSPDPGGVSGTTWAWIEPALMAVPMAVALLLLQHILRVGPLLQTTMELHLFPEELEEELPLLLHIRPKQRKRSLRKELALSRLAWTAAVWISCYRGYKQELRWCDVRKQIAAAHWKSSTEIYNGHVNAQRVP